MTQSLNVVSNANVNKIDITQYRSLKLKNGQIAADLPADVLRKELQKLGVPEISEVEGVGTMLPKFAKWLEARTTVQWPEQEG